MKTPWEIELIKPEQKWEITLNDKVAYTLPIASPEQLGGVKPDGKTEEMTLPVGVDEQGKLWTSGSDEAVLFVEQTLTDEQKTQARENIGAGVPQVQADAMQTDEAEPDYINNQTILPFPIYETYTFYGTTRARVSIFDLKTNRLYTSLFNIATGYAIGVPCDDGTFKTIMTLYFGAIYRPIVNGTNAYVYSDLANEYVYVDFSDKSTANNVIVTKYYNYKFLDTANVIEYTPTSNYHPATKKYVDDSIASIPEQVQADWSQTDEAAANFIKNKPEIATDDEIIEMLTQEDMLPVVTDSDGSILADENDNILLW